MIGLKIIGKKISAGSSSRAEVLRKDACSSILVTESPKVGGVSLRDATGHMDAAVAGCPQTWMRFSAKSWRSRTTVLVSQPEVPAVTAPMSHLRPDCDLDGQEAQPDSKIRSAPGARFLVSTRCLNGRTPNLSLSGRPIAMPLGSPSSLSLCLKILS